MKYHQTVVIFSALSAAFIAQPVFSDNLSARYAKSVTDAAVVESNETVTNLDAVNQDNNTLIWNDDRTKIKVVTWKSQSAYDNFLAPYTQTSSNPDFAIWVTLAPKIQEFCRNINQHASKNSTEALNLRLKQYLGLNAQWKYDVFVELWVKPEDIFRPCVDPDPSDNSCEADFGSNNPQVKNITDYKAFYQSLYYKSFRAAPGVPWTGLGYTYDWKNASTKAGLNGEQGASEFILSPSSSYTIEQAVPTADYCKP